MRRVFLVGLCVAGSLFAQRGGRGGGGRRGPSHWSGASQSVGAAGILGNVLYPTTGAGRGNRIGGRFRSRNRGGAGYAYASPFYYGDGYGYMDWGPDFWYDDSSAPYSSSYAPAPEEQSAQQPPSVIINQYFTSEHANPVTRDYAPGELPPAQPQSDPGANASSPVESAASGSEFFLLAFKDGSVQKVRAYWVEGNTISYVLPYGSVSRVTLDQVDRDASERLNRDRHIDFHLPPAS